MNVEVIADPAGRLIWASAALPGAVHDLTAARIHTIIDALTREKVMTFADKAYQGARGSIRIPFKRHRYRPKLTTWQKKVNRAHARSVPSANAPTPVRRQRGSSRGRG